MFNFRREMGLRNDNDGDECLLKIDRYFSNISLLFFFFRSRMDGPAVLSMPPITAPQKSAQSPQPQSHSKSNQVSYVFFILHGILIIVSNNGLFAVFLYSPFIEKMKRSNRRKKRKNSIIRL